MNVPETNQKRVVVVGGGFGGLELIKGLRKADVQVVLIDKHNYHTFQPLLYQVATSGLEPDSIAYPLRKIFEGHPNFYFRMAEAQEVLSEKQELRTNIGNIHYDFLVLATGSQTNYFGMEQVMENALPMKSVPEALDLRSLILQNFEKALLTNDLVERESLMNFVIVGAGPTGVELAGALGELKKHILPRDYPDLDIRRMNIHLIEADSRALAAMSKEASEKAHKFLKDLDVQIWLNTLVSGYENGEVITKGGKSFRSHAFIWTAGVMGTPLVGIRADSLGTGRRIKVDDFNSVVGMSNVYALGDVALMETDETPQGHPMLAQVAIQQGRLLSRNIINSLKGRELRPFSYNDKGSMATIGRNLAVVDLPSIKFQGAFAWFVWMFIHLISLVGFRNKLIVFVNWSWSYFNFDKGVRLIIRPFRKSRG